MRYVEVATPKLLASRCGTRAANFLDRFLNWNMDDAAELAEGPIFPIYFYVIGTRGREPKFAFRGGSTTSGGLGGRVFCPPPPSPGGWGEIAKPIYR